MNQLRNLRLIALPVAGVLCAAAPPPPSGDERMILAHEAFVVTFDASTIAIAGSERRARMHI